MDLIRLTSVSPKLPMHDLATTKGFYVEKLGFRVLGEYGNDYLIVEKDTIQLHFFRFRELKAEENYGMCYIQVSENISTLYQQYVDGGGVIFPELGHLAKKPWGKQEFSILDPTHNLLTFGESVN